MALGEKALKEAVITKCRGMRNDIRISRAALRKGKWKGGTGTMKDPCDLDPAQIDLGLDLLEEDLRDLILHLKALGLEVE